MSPCWYIVTRARFFWRYSSISNYKPQLTLYYRDGCHLCEDLEQQLYELLEPHSFVLQKLDIDADSALRDAYNVRVPVLNCENEEVCEHFLDLEELRNALERAHASYNRTMSSTDNTS
ncbi:MAG: glutaredoxin family protein [Granulosicoccus sp.]